MLNADPRTLRQLAEKIEAIECRRMQRAGGGGPAGSSGVCVPTGWTDVDAFLASRSHGHTDRPPDPAGDDATEDRPPGARGLARGVIHEWFGVAETNAAESDARMPAARSRRGANRWTPPLLILTHLAWQALASTLEAGAGRWVVWLGRSVWPHPRSLIRNGPQPHDAADRRLLKRSLFVDPPNGASRLWAIDLALRCPAVAAVIADGCGLRTAHTRRLQLAAEHHGALALLARPPDERKHLSTAATRWWVCRAPSIGRAPRWTVQLLRCKGVQRVMGMAKAAEAGACWWLEWDCETSRVRLPADVVDRPDQAPSSARTGSGRGPRCASDHDRIRIRRTA